ncbi:MAG: hypothetical protein II855_05380 [Candidatus Methanomethylophilaceae archaeon]|nr:hypothetical protein [Candidatus Methanomethylophilaceae archaeon]
MNAGKFAAPILLVAMFMTSLMAIAIRNLVDEGLSVFDATFLRLSIAAAVIVLAVIATRSWHVFKIKPRDFVFFILFAVIIGTAYYGEPLDLQDVLGVLLLVGSIIMISFADAKKRKGKDAASPESSDPVDGDISG